MIRYAALVEGVAANVILWDGEAPLDIQGDLVVAPDHIGPGWTYDGVEWGSPYPEPEPPEEV